VSHPAPSKQPLSRSFLLLPLLGCFFLRVFRIFLICVSFVHGGEGPQIWGVAANIFSKQSRTAYKDDSPAWG
jgi:hypothetical protein